MSLSSHDTVLDFLNILAAARHGGQWRGTPSRSKLEEIGLEQYASALIDDKGYDDLGALQGLTKHQAEEIADNVQMKPGHKRKPL